MAIYSLGERSPQLDPAGCYIAPSAIVIGSVELQHGASIWFNTVARGDDEKIVIGVRSNVQDGSVLHADPGYPIQIGRDTTIGHKVMLHGCIVGDEALIGMGATILNGAKIGHHTLIGAGSLVPEGKIIPDGVLALGIPCKVIRELDGNERANILRIAETYVQRALRYRHNLKLLPEDR